MSLFKRLMGKDDEAPKVRTRVCVECGMPIAEHREWCSILRAHQRAAQAPSPRPAAE
jgi:hypothetical protein